jgi:hypothetical protein
MADAKIRLSVDGTSQVVSELGTVAIKMGDLQNTVVSAGSAIKSALLGASALLGTLAIADKIKDMAMLSARFETLGAAMTVVGKNAGYTKEQMDANALALQKTGISMIESRQQTMRLVQAHIDLSASTKLARIAQDAAVIGNMNSSEAFAHMIHGIQTGQTDVLRTIGLNVSMEQSYKQMAATLHKNADQLSQNEKTQAVLNAVLAEGKGIAGTYEAAMDTAGKQVLSMTRYSEDLKVKQGEVFNEVLTIAVMAYTNHLKDANGEMDEMAKNGELKAWGEDLAQLFVSIANAIDNILNGIKMVANWAAHQSAGTEINKKFTNLQVNGSPEFPKKATAQGMSDQWDQIEKLRIKALADEQKFYEQSQVDMASHADRFLKAYEDRLKAKAAKDAKSNSDSLNRQSDYQAKSLQVQQAYASSSVAVQQAAQQQLAQSFFGDNHSYEDTKSAPKAGAGADSPIKTLIKSLQEKIALTNLDIEALGKLTEAEKLSAKIKEDFINKTLKGSEAEKQQVNALREKYLEREKINLQSKKDEDATLKATEAHVKYVATLFEGLDKLKEQVSQQQEFNDRIGLTKEAIAALDAAKLEEQATTLDGLAIKKLDKDLDETQYNLYKNQAAELRNLAKLKVTGTKKQADFDDAKRALDELDAESKRFIGSIYQGLSDSLYRGFEAGKGFGRSFLDGISNLFKTTVLKLAVQGVMGGITGSLGMSSAQAATGASGSLFGSAPSLLSAGSTLYQGFNAAMASAGTLGTGFLGSLSGGLMGAGAGSGLTSAAGLAIGESIAGVVGPSVAGALSSGMAAIAAAAPWAAAAVAVYAIGKKAFGMSGDMQTTGTTIRGNLGTNNLSNVTGTHQDGGWLSSDWNDTWTRSLANSVTTTAHGGTYDNQTSAVKDSDKATLKSLNDGYSALKASTAEYAKVLGLNADSIKSRTDAMSFAIGKDAAETQSNIGKMFADVGDKIAADLLGPFSALKKDGEGAAAAMVRLGADLTGANAAMKALGFSAYSVSVDGVKAAEGLITLFGGLQNLQTVSAQYYDNFYTDAEKLSLSTAMVRDAFAAAGQTMPSTREGLRAMVDAAKAAGDDKNFAALM